jgi:hypothetical protein
VANFTVHHPDTSITRVIADSHHVTDAGALVLAGPAGQEMAAGTWTSVDQDDIEVATATAPSPEPATLAEADAAPPSADVPDAPEQEAGDSAPDQAPAAAEAP